MVYSCAPVNIAPPDVASWSDSNIDGRVRLFFLQRHTIYILTKKKKKKKKRNAAIRCFILILFLLKSIANRNYGTELIEIKCFVIL